jgi:hypothetical protein
MPSAISRKRAITCATRCFRARYEEITAAVSDQLAHGLALEVLMGSHIDALKLVSCPTSSAPRRSAWLKTTRPQRLRLPHVSRV